MPWITNEDAALKFKLQAIYVDDENAPAEGREVPVFYEMPEVEVQDMTYPSIGIEPLGWFRDPEREHRGYIQIPYAPEGFDPWWDTSAADPEFNPNDSPYSSYFPIPYNFDYQITVFSRYQYHLTTIVSELAQYNRLHPHFAYLDIPQDGTKRSLFVNAGPYRGFAHDEHNKRLLTATYNIRVCSELLGNIDAPPQFGGTQVLVKQVNLDFGVYGSLADITPEEITESVGILSVGALSGWNTK